MKRTGLQLRYITIIFLLIGNVLVAQKTLGDTGDVCNYLGFEVQANNDVSVIRGDVVLANWNTTSLNFQMNYEGCQGFPKVTTDLDNFPWVRVINTGKNRMEFSLSNNETAVDREVTFTFDHGTMLAGGIPDIITIKQKANPSYSFYYKDTDGDGYGDYNAEPVSRLTAAAGEVDNNLDYCIDEPSTTNNGCLEPYEDRNWTRSKTYDINGRLIGSAKNYYNDLGKLEQSQSYDSKHNRVLASQTIYDAQGRPALQSLSAPVREGENYNYQEGFVEKTTGGELTTDDLDTDDTLDPTILNTSTLGAYYYNNQEEALMDKTERPYTRSVYSELMPGAVMQTIGGNKQNGEWRRGYSFSMPAAQEMYYVYGYSSFSGNPAIAATYYTDIDGDLSDVNKHLVWLKAGKTVVQDIKGNESVVFTDADGKTLGAARSGGAKGYQVLSLIGEQKYVDVHIPVGCENTATLLGNASDYKIFDLKTEQPNGDISKAGFYRIEYTGSKTLTKSHTLTYIDKGSKRIEPVKGNDAVGIRYEVNYYDFSLNYYNEVGQLTSSLQPLGFVDTCLDGLQANVSHNDKLKSNFVYNALGQLTHTQSPDEGHAWFIYRKDGQIRFSINSKQWNHYEISYTSYDELGRPVQSGVHSDREVLENFPGDEHITMDTYPFKSILMNSVEVYQSDLPNHNRKEQHFTEYDFLSSSAQTWLNSNAGVAYRNPTFLSGNVARTYNMEGSTILSRTYYSYDVYGRVKWIIQDIEGLGVKTIDYEYDPITSQVNKVYFQKGNATEQFIHKYTYDEHTQQLVKVETSSDDSIFTTHADYTYYQTNGALKRTELAGGIQGIDYVYNLAGQLKAINHPSLTKELDPNGDETDLFGMTLDYYGGDYQRNSNFTFNNNLMGIEDQYTGNIKGMTWNTKRTTDANTTPVLYKYKYDRNNWLKEAIFDGMGNQQNDAPKDITFNEKLTTSRNAAATDFIVLKEGFEIKASSSVTFSAKIVDVNTDGTYGTDDYKVHNITYDANGNIESLHRNKNTEGGSNKMDELTYTYKEDKPNQLDYVKDDAGNVGVGDIGTQSAGNYVYNSIGQLEENIEEDVKYEYNASGLVTKVFYNDALKVQFYYNDKNFRTKKVSYLDGGGSKTTHYVLDASGSTLAIYENQQLEELPIYGASRLGIHKKQSGTNVYQLTDHLGNVRAVIAKNGSTAVAATSTTDYYPFGMPMPNRQIVNGEHYRYAYQGQEKDPETGKEAFQLRLWDARIGRWLTTDPAHAHPSPYLGMANNPINTIDPDGGCPCSECPENCGEGTIDPATDSSSAFPNTSGQQLLDEVVIGGSNGVKNITGYHYTAKDLRIRSILMESRILRHSILDLESRGYYAPMGLQDWIDFHGASHYNSYRFFTAVTLSYELLAPPSFGSISPRGFNLRGYGKGSPKEVYIYRAPREGTMDDIMNNGFRKADHSSGDRRIYFGEESVAGEYAKTGAYDSFLIKIKVKESFLKGHTFKYAAKKIGGPSRLEYRIPVEKIDFLNTLDRTKIGPYW
ncbi:RHS repeat-associated protein [Tenacibaculum sp. 190524A02b]|uniref:RHS repeat domain-containing protein n=1 Tax=Tenacibaculum vairaonense TaxID=3137860 RepID=UPI0032B1E160